MSTQLSSAGRFQHHLRFISQVYAFVGPDEAIEIAAKREVFEETNIVCDIQVLISQSHNTEGNITVSIYKAAYVNGFIKKDDTEILDAQWFSFADALLLPLAYNCTEIIKAIRDRI